MSNFYMTLYYNTVRQNAKNAKYPNKLVIFNTEDLKKAVAYDHVCAEYKDNYRKKSNYIQSDCAMFDVDNSGTDNPDEWITPEDVQKAFPDVPFYASYSRNHMKPKDGKAPRPKFHVYFPDMQIKDRLEYERYKEAVCRYFLHFDFNAKDAARFFYGVENPTVEYFDGNTLLYDFMQSVNTDNGHAVKKELPDTDIIPEGQRNTTMLKFANRILKRYGENDGISYQAFLKESERCSPPLEETELDDIWKSACKFYHKTIQNDVNYISPQQYSPFELDVTDGNALAKLISVEKENRRFNIDVCRTFLQAFGITVKLNDMNNCHEINGLPSKFNLEEADKLLETLLIDTAKKLSYKGVSDKSVHSILNLIANENHYHPVLKLLSEKQWDGNDRLNQLYQIMGITETLHKTLVKKWALQTIAVLYNSSSNPVFAENMLVLQGGQGVGKTQLFRHLAIKNEFFLGGAVLDMQNKDTLMAATRVWICELGEMDGTTRKKQSALKGFLSKQTDNFREPYAPKEIHRCRRTSFCGTVNPTAFLTDETGNRRFWTIPIQSIDLDKVFAYDSEWYAQLWRQIQTEYLENPKGYLLTKEEQDSVNLRNEEFETLVQGEDEFMTMFDTDCDISCWTVRLTAAQIAKHLNEEFRSLNISSVSVGKQLIPKIEKRTGKTFPRIKSGKQYIYCPPFSKDYVHLYDSYTD